MKNRNVCATPTCSLYPAPFPRASTPAPGPGPCHALVQQAARGGTRGHSAVPVGQGGSQYF